MNRFTTFLLLYLFWILWSGMFDAFHLGLGIISVFIVVKWTGDLFLKQKKSFAVRVKEWWRFEKYSVWLFWQIILANYEVFKLAFHPNVLSLLNPKYISFKSEITGDVAQFIFAQSITLTPGTITLSISDGVYRVHALNDDAASALPGEMEKRVLTIFKGNNHG
ncbi:MAG: Na+/H+ antiporter subunit E [Candidatus Margulisiibacteriota bacterium]